MQVYRYFGRLMQLHVYMSMRGYENVLMCVDLVRAGGGHLGSGFVGSVVFGFRLPCRHTLGLPDSVRLGS